MTKNASQPTRLSISGARAEALDQARLRVVWVVMAVMMGYLVIGLRMTDLMFFRRPAETVATAKDVRPLAKPLRGAVTDRNGTLMASSLKMASVYADTTLIDAPEALARKLSAIIPEQPYKDILTKLSSGKKFIWIQRDVTPKQQYAINALGDPALGFQEEGRRIYPDGPLAAHILGYTDVDGNGIAGIEKSFDQKLGEKGEDLQLSIDLRVQHIVRRELSDAVKKFRAKGGLAMVMDANNGEIVAMVSLPDYDPNHVAAAKPDEKFNRGTLGVFEMGSTFKLFATAGALESGRVRFSSIFDATNPIQIGRFKISDFHAKKRAMTVPEVFIYSSNIGTAKMAEAMGPGGLKNFYQSLGFMSKPEVELPERGAPLVPSPWREVSTLTASYGHGIAVTPLHVMRAAAGLVNGGLLPKATLVRDPRNSLSLSATGTRVVSAETSAKVRQLLELVVGAGTGDKAYAEGYNVGGKTGTAEKNLNGRYEKNALFSSFLAAFPMQAPRYVVLAAIDEPKGTEDTYGYATGGWTAAPVVGRIIEQMGPLYQIPPDMTRGKKDIVREMSAYLKEFKEGASLASAGNDH